MPLSLSNDGCIRLGGRRSRAHHRTRLLEHPEDAHPVPRVDRRRPFAIGPGADAPVELDVVATFQRDRLVAFLASDPSWGRLAEAVVTGPHAVAQLRLLRVDAVAGEPACQTADAEA